MDLPNLKINENILISVVVIAYNSEEYIVETLESIKNQTYSKIQLIISDDCSTDETRNLAEKWVNNNKERFIECKILASEFNKGITSNCNQGISQATGDYVKLVAADDILLENCLTDMLKFSLKNNLSISFSKVIPFSETAEIKFIEKVRFTEEFYAKDFFEKDQHQQYKSLLTQCSITALGCFMKRSLLLEVEGYDENYKMMEDYPFWVKVSSLGHKFNLLDRHTVKYRVRNPEIKNSFRKSKRYNMHYLNLRDYQSNELYPRMKKEKMWIEMYHLFIIRFATKIDHESDKKYISIFSKMIRYLSPLHVKTKLKLITLKYSQ